MQLATLGLNAPSDLSKTWNRTVLHSLGARIRSWMSEPQFRWGMALAVIGVLERAWLWSVYQPISYSDTNGYMRLARVLSRLTLEGYAGTRVPGFPALLAAVGLDPEQAWLAQMALGWLISLLLFWMTWRVTGSTGLGIMIGGLYNFIPGQILFEANLLTETLTTFWVVLSLTLLVVLRQVNNQVAGIILALVLGVSASATGMVRPLFFPLTVWLVPFVWFAVESDWRHRLLRVLVFSMGPLLIQGGWLLFIYNRFHMLSPTTMGGFSLVQHTGEYFEYLPDSVASIRDTYLIYRDLHIAERGVQTNAIWDAIPAMTEASGLSSYALSRKMSQLSIQLILQHPDLYLRNVLEGWVAFWKAPVYWQPSAVHSGVARGLIAFMVPIGRGISIIANGLFLFISLIALMRKVWRVRLGFGRQMVASAGLVWWISIVQTLVDHGDNPRFLVPLQMVVFMVVICSLWFYFHNTTSIEVAALKEAQIREKE
ncbi:MAG: hypothetical protein E3J37_04685 [Anaerolineales bacterium]|nr:MAG: hypothetical protein E3J37_04685 [Anaerolineales bacterium]